MKTCRRGHAFEGRQCKVCKAAWERVHRPVRGTTATRRAALRESRYYPDPGQLSGKPVALGEHEAEISLDRACRICNSPTSWGLCKMCAKGYGVDL